MSRFPLRAATAVIALGLMAAACGGQDERTATSENAGVDASDAAGPAPASSSAAVGPAAGAGQAETTTGAASTGGAAASGDAQVSGTEAAAVGAVDSRDTPRGIAEVGARPPGQAGVDASASAE